MPGSFVRWAELKRFLIISVGLGLAALLGGCSAWRIAYNQGPQWAYWWLDRYADFSDAQEPRVKEALAQWFQWHRRTQLPVYSQLLEQMRQDTSRDMTDTQMCDWWETIVKRGDDAFEVSVPAIAALAATFAPHQLQSIERRLAKNGRELRDEYLQPDLKERHREAFKRTLERIETLYGRLDTAQREYVDRMVARSPWDAERWLAERERRSRDTVGTLQLIATKKDMESAQAQALVRAWIARSLQPAAPDEESQGYYQKLKAYNCTFAAGVHNLTTAAQRKHAADKLQDWRQDISDLMGAGPVGGAAMLGAGVGGSAGAAVRKP